MINASDLYYNNRPTELETTPLKSSNYIASSNENIPCNTGSGSFNITLPNLGNRVRVFDAVGNSDTTGFGANSLFVIPNSGTTIMGSDSFEIDLGGSSFDFVLVGNDWRVSGGLTPIQNHREGYLDYLANTSPLILSNNSRINGVEHFYQSAKPTVRGDTSALVIGDRWWKIDTGEEWFWNGTYWLSPVQTLSHPQLTNITTTSNALSASIPSDGYVLISEVLLYSLVSITNDASNYWEVDVSIAPVQNTGVSVALFSTDLDAPNMRVGKKATPNAVVTSNFPVSPSGLVLRVYWTKIGSPSLLYAAVSLKYHFIYL